MTNRLGIVSILGLVAYAFVWAMVSAFLLAIVVSGLMSVGIVQAGDIFNLSTSFIPKTAAGFELWTREISHTLAVWIPAASQGLIIPWVAIAALTAWAWFSLHLIRICVWPSAGTGSLAWFGALLVLPVALDVAPSFYTNLMVAVSDSQLASLKIVQILGTLSVIIGLALLACLLFLPRSVKFTAMLASVAIIAVAFTAVMFILDVYIVTNLTSVASAGVLGWGLAFFLLLTLKTAVSSLDVTEGRSQEPAAFVDTALPNTSEGKSSTASLALPLSPGPDQAQNAASDAKGPEGFGSPENSGSAIATPSSANANAVQAEPTVSTTKDASGNQNPQTASAGDRRLVAGSTSAVSTALAKALGRKQAALVPQQELQPPSPASDTGPDIEDLKAKDTVDTSILDDISKEISDLMNKP